MSAIFLSIQLANLSMLSGLAVREVREAVEVRRRVILPSKGLQVRVHFLGLMVGGLCLKLLTVVVIVVNRILSPMPLTPFTLALCHCLPALVLLSSYSMAAMFLARLTQIQNPVMWTPILIGSNLTMYIVFFVVTSITKIHKAHREFRISAMFFLALSHLALAAVWAYYGVGLALKLYQRKRANSTSQQEEMNSSPPSALSLGPDHAFSFTQHFPPQMRSSSTASGSDIPLTLLPQTSQLDHTPLLLPNSPDSSATKSRSLISRLLFISLLCPPAFLLSGCLEFYVSCQLWHSQPYQYGSDLIATWCPLSAAFYTAEVLPAHILLLALLP